MLFYSPACKQVSQNTAASYWNGAVKPETNTTFYGTGLAKKLIISSQKNVSHDPLVLMENIYSPTLHMNFGLMKQFVKTMDKTEDGFIFSKTKYLRLWLCCGIKANCLHVGPGPMCGSTLRGRGGVFLKLLILKRLKRRM